MLRRGFSSVEFQQLTLPEFYELWLFETFIEPQGPVMNDFYQARITHSIFANNPNITKEGRKKLNMKEFYIIKDKVFKSEEELEKERQNAQEANRKNIESLFDPKQLEKMKALKARKERKNG